MSESAFAKEFMIIDSAKVSRQSSYELATELEAQAASTRVIADELLYTSYANAGAALQYAAENQTVPPLDVLDGAIDLYNLTNHRQPNTPMEFVRGVEPAIAKSAVIELFEASKGGEPILSWNNLNLKSGYLTEDASIAVDTKSSDPGSRKFRLSAYIGLKVRPLAEAGEMKIFEHQQSIAYIVGRYVVGRVMIQGAIDEIKFTTSREEYGCHPGINTNATLIRKTLKTVQVFKAEGLELDDTKLLEAQTRAEQYSRNRAQAALLQRGRSRTRY